jgi:hypothetical protein
MNVFYILDSTAIIIALPTIVLWGLLIASAHEKRCYPWPMRSEVPAICTDLSQPRLAHTDAISIKNNTALQSVRWELVTYLLCAASGSGIFLLCSSYLFWPVRPPLSDLHLMIPVFNNMCISLSLTLPFLLYRQIALFRQDSRENAKSILSTSQFVLSVSILFFALLLTLPIVQLVGIGLGLSSESVRVMRDVFRMFMAFSTIPTSIAGLAILSSGVMVQRRKVKAALNFLQFEDAAALDVKTVDELHYLIGVALKHGKIDAADRISMHLLRRVETNADA